jgi:signal transduction histidine kinase
LVKEECLIKNIELKLDVDPDLMILGDSGQLEMVVLNLLNNAIEAVEDQNTKRSIAITSTKIEGKTYLSVEDSGVGVPIAAQEHIFELFRTSKNDGMGVGLWLSRAVMENHRGYLMLDKNSATGARFVMQFQEAT